MSARTILCIRHGESTFNVAYRETGIDPLHPDARLTPRGEAQVREARLALRSVPVDLVVTSPLTRALQTTQGIFADHPSAPRVLVEALHREHCASSCDIGRSPAELAAEFPHLALDHLPETWWHVHDEPDERGVCFEPIEALQERVELFKDWLRARPEPRIAVVGHGTFFHHLTGQWLDNCGILPLDLDAL